MHDAHGAQLFPASDMTYLQSVHLQLEPEDALVLDANHPLAGMALRFSVVILTVREATEEEQRRGVSLP